MLIEGDYPLRERNTFHMDVRARWFVEYDSVEELIALLNSELIRENKWLAVGAGSNLLFTGDYPGVILHSRICFVKREKEDDKHVWLRVGSGVVWDDFCAYAVENGLGGCENLSYIPGEVGASAVQNIGAYGVEVSDIIEEVETVRVENGQKRIFLQAECLYGYRASVFKKELKGKFIVTSVLYRLDKKPEYRLDYGNLREELGSVENLSPERVRRAVINIRKNKLPDPEVAGNAGSFFMNPVIGRDHYDRLLQRYPGMPHYPVDDNRVKVPAAWLIDQCGWKGKMVGGAAVHDKQCLVLINKNQATASEVIRLAESICESVRTTFGIDIHPEVNYI
ncbi:MAG: UDP-N-acetylmuramate dehydrogenase [Bacteroidales bacterium]